MQEILKKVKFELNKTVVYPNKYEVPYRTYFYDIHSSQDSKYFIKIYTEEDEKLNDTLAKQLVKVSNTIVRSNLAAFKVHNVLSVSPYRIVLTDSYLNDFAELLNCKFYSTQYSILKFLFQMAGFIETMRTEGLEGLYISPQSPVVNSHMNYKLTHLDINLNDSNIRVIVQKKDFDEFQFAPEFYDGGKYTIASNVWDLGVLLYSALVGEMIKVDYNNRSVFFNENLLDKNSPLSGLVRGMLSFQPEVRPKPNEILSVVVQMIAQTHEPYIFGTPNPNSKEIVFSYLDFGCNPSHHIYDSFSPPSSRLKKYSKTVRDTVAMIWDNNTIIKERVMEGVIQKMWRQPEKLIKFYHELKDSLERNITNMAAVMKLLIALHTFVFRTHRSSLVVYFKDKQTNAIEWIFRTVHSCYLKNKEPLIMDYSGYLLRKHKFNFSYIKLIENNYAVSKITLFEIWPELITGPLITDLINHITATFNFFVAFKRHKFNYFSKNVLLFLAREFINLLALACNVLSLIIYVDHYVELSGPERNLIDGFISNTVELLDDYVGVYQVSISEMKRHGNMAFVKMELHVEIPKQVARFKRRCGRRSNEFSIKEFSSKFYSSVMRMPEGHENKGTELSDDAFKKERDLQRATDCLRLLCEHLSQKTFNCPQVFAIIPNFKNVDHSGLEMSEISKDTTNNAEESNIKVKLNGEGLEGERDEMRPTMMPAEKREVGVQADIPKEERERLKEIQQLQEDETQPLIKLDGVQDPANAIRKDKSHGNLRVSALRISMTEENFDTHEGLEKFLLKAFARSVDEWIVDFQDIKFESLIATGSTCNVYKGSYKNLTVAIKKLVKPETDNKIKFLKEFKRELSLLVSLPNHSSLLTLVGFCVKDHEVYLLSEFCYGGTLFDLLYKKSIPIKLN
jgi:serine/threonine protein kinase